MGLVPAPLYPDPHNSLIFNNYPPLSFYLVGWLGYAIGDMVWAGRILALSAWFGTVILIFRLILQTGGNRLGAHIGSLIFALYSSYFFHSYIAMNDPQWMAHFFMLLGLSAIIQKQTALRITTAATFFIIGGLIKHNLFALPLAVTGWLFIRDKKMALLWVTLGLAGIIISTIGFNALYHNHFMIVDILHHKRVITLRRIKKALGRLAIFLPLIIFSASFLKKNIHLAKTSPKGLLAIFASLSLLFGIFESLGEGVSYNAFFESLIAFSLIVGLLFSNRWTEKRPFLSSAVVAFLPVLATSAFCLPNIIGHQHRLYREKQQWDDVISYVKAIKSPVICDISEICYWAGKDYKLDFFNFYQAVKRGASLDPLNKAIVTPVPNSMIRITLANKNPTYSPLWKIIMSYPHRYKRISPHVEIIEITGQKK
ncbi:hypothetical protein [Zymomonas mobilis]|uniref:hypothetical protein n=1 Tax=Zymomonas mobilis TaxID=542 RepID=UPI0021AB3EF7|nr:hypothetical protein [Zymomonas mobilis]